MTEADLFQLLLGAWSVVALLVFGLLCFVTAPYGRHARGGWGPRVDATLGWVLMESPALLAVVACFIVGGRTGAAPTALLALWVLHYGHRALVYPLRRRGVGAPMPLSVPLLALAFNLVNGYLQGRWLFALGPVLEDAWLRDPRFIAGAALFLAGFAINVDADARLARLRRPGEGGYRVPTGGLYRWVSCPNYLGEILEWLGWALATWSLAGLVFAWWTIANLAPRARAHHRWYRERFPDYPAERRALIPFVA